MIEPATTQQKQLPYNNKAAAFANCVCPTLLKFTPWQFCRAKKCIWDILYQIEENSDFNDFCSMQAMQTIQPQHKL